MDDKNVQQPDEEVLSQEAKEQAGPVDELQVVKDQLAAEKEKHIRLLAEFDNMRKRQERERLELIKYAHEEVIIEMLKTYEDLERSLNAFKAKEGTDPNLVKGLQMVYDNMRQLMNKYDVKPIETVGKPFDLNQHEVLMQAETKDFADGVVMEEFQKGYTLAGRVVRTAKVKVAKNINS
jgi:molecular chaperone GrpE